jgi:hypothetical protein
MMTTGDPVQHVALVSVKPLADRALVAQIQVPILGFAITPIESSSRLHW